MAGPEPVGLRADSSRLHNIGLGRRLSGTRVLELLDDLRVRVLTQDGDLIREPCSTQPAITSRTGEAR